MANGLLFFGILICSIKDLVLTQKPRIVNGDDAKLGQFKYHALLHIKYAWKSVGECGGSLINPQYVLTAAHCLDGVSGLWVTLGEVDVDDEDAESSSPHRVYVEAKQWVKHEKYQASSAPLYDIGLIQLESPVETNKYISPIALYRNDTDFYIGKTLTITGFGQTGENAVNTDILKFTTVKMISNEECNQLITKSETVIRLKYYMMCAVSASPSQVQDMCYGDSGNSPDYKFIVYLGGPLVDEEDDVQIGVISFGTTDCGGDSPGGYTRVESFAKWIDKKIEVADSGKRW